MIAIDEIESDTLSAPDVEQREDAQRDAYLAEFGQPDALNDRPDVDVYLDRLIERVAELRAEARENNEIAARRMAIIAAWRDDVNATLAKREAWLVSQIRAHAEGYDFGKKKSRKLPSGTFGFRKKGGGFRIFDKPAILAFAKSCGIPVKVTEEVLLTPIKEYVQATGEIPPGVEDVPEVQEFYVTEGSND